MRFPRSIRLRITAVSAMAVAIVLVVTALVILSVQRRQLFQALDNSLEQRSEVIRSGLRADEFGALVTSDDGDRFVQLVGLDGLVEGSSANVEGLAPAAESADFTGFATVSDFDLEDDSYRVLVSRTGDGRSLVVGENRDDVNDAMRNLALTLFVAVPVVVSLLAALTWWLVGRTLQPVARIRREVSGIGAGALDRRVRPPATDDEVADLVGTMNEMLDRVETATKRQESFVADASHELKTPLTRMRTEIEVDLAERGEPDVLVSSLLDEVVGLQHLVEDLLQLADADAGKAPTRHVAVDLDDLGMQEAAILRESNSCTIDTSGVAAGEVAGDRVELLRMARNLLDNATRHARTTVWIAIAQERGRVKLVVSDDGPGAADNDLDVIFDRFSRLDASRTASSGGTGLGLAIVRDIVDRHSGRVWAEANSPAGLRIVVDLPGADRPDAHP
ncbi:MAG: sensor histidine kinase [Acidimicrobiales bacterium]